MEPLEIEIPHLNKTLYMPLTLQQCDTRQYIAFHELLYQLESAQINYGEFRLLATYKLLDIDVGSRNRINDREADEVISNMLQIAEHIDHYFNIEDQGASLVLGYTHNHITEIKPQKHTFYGPKVYFTDVTWGEFSDAVNVFMEFNRSKDISLLRRLMAIFFRKRFSSAEEKHLRVPYKEEYTDLKVTLFEDLSIGELYGFYYTFANFHTYFTSSGVSWEGQPIDMSIIFTEQDGDEDNDYESPFPSLGLKSIEFQLSESGVFGSNKDLRETNLWTVALRLYDIRKRDLDRAAQTKQKKS